MTTVFHSYFALFRCFPLSSKGTHFYCVMKTVLSVFVPLVPLPLLTFSSVFSFHCSFSFTSPSFHHRSQASCYLLSLSFLFGDHVINFFLENDVDEKNDGLRKKNMLRVLWTILRLQKEVPWMEGTMMLEAFHAAPSTLWPVSVSTVPLLLKFHVAVTTNNMKRMARGLEGDVQRVDP